MLFLPAGRPGRVSPGPPQGPRPALRPHPPSRLKSTRSDCVSQAQGESRASLSTPPAASGASAGISTSRPSSPGADQTPCRAPHTCRPIIVIAQKLPLPTPLGAPRAPPLQRELQSLPRRPVTHIYMEPRGSHGSHAGRAPGLGPPHTPGTGGATLCPSGRGGKTLWALRPPPTESAQGPSGG